MKSMQNASQLLPGFWISRKRLLRKRRYGSAPQDPLDSLSENIFFQLFIRPGALAQRTSHVRCEECFPVTARVLNLENSDSAIEELTCRSLCIIIGLASLFRSG